jgi:hypothetical protein
MGEVVVSTREVASQSVTQVCPLSERDSVNEVSVNGLPGVARVAVRAKVSTRVSPEGRRVSRREVKGEVAPKRGSGATAEVVWVPSGARETRVSAASRSVTEEVPSGKVVARCSLPSAWVSS